MLRHLSIASFIFMLAPHTHLALAVTPSRHRMVNEEGVHSLGRAWPLRIGKRACGTATVPGVPHAIYRPVFLNLPAIRIIPAPHFEGMSARYLPVGHATGAAEAGIIRAAGASLSVVIHCCTA